MRVIPLHRESSTDYSCVSYWVLGDRNASADRNTLIDAGSRNPENSAYFFHEMAALSKGIGKAAVEQVILTHDHYDHSGGLAVIERQFAPAIYSWTPQPGRREAVHDGMHLTVGDQDAILLHTPGHSEDSLCVYVPCTRTLFSGDSVFRISDSQGSYSRAYLESLERLAALDISTIYPGHGQPILTDAGELVRACIAFVRRSLVVD
jgi:glyoxylase-like metal-dependent hydrolase (beta-lactamase superfamily II)